MADGGSLTLYYAPQLVPTGQGWIETIAADALKWLLIRENFADVMANGKRIFDLVTETEAKCKREGTEPTVLSQSFSKEEDARLTEISTKAKIPKSMAHKVAFVRFCEVQYPPQVADKDGFFPADPRVEEKLFGNSSSSGINFDDYDNIPIDVTGKDVPPPMIDFTSIALHPVLKNNIKLCKYTKPTPVQKNGLPIISAGRDIMACAQTGSGKTAAFLVPIINNLLKAGSYVKDTCEPLCLVLSPTRELAIQTHEECLKFIYRTQLRAEVVYGGGGGKPEPSEIIIATPGRLIDLVKRDHIKLHYVQYFVLDEADRMLDMGFNPQIRQLEVRIPGKEDRQTLMFSATFPDAIQTMAEDFLNENYIFVKVGRVGAASQNVSQALYLVEESEKTQHLLKHIDSTSDSTIVFVKTKIAAVQVYSTLKKKGYSVDTIHGDLEQLQRETALDAFKKGDATILVATDVASRGLDVRNIKYVINYDMPDGIDDYVHRIGRTGRAGNVGHAISFMTNQNLNISIALANLLEENNQSIPDWLPGMVEIEKKRREDRDRGADGKGGACFNCGQEGHLSRQCPEGNRGGRGGRGRGGRGGSRGGGRGGGGRNGGRRRNDDDDDW